MNYSKLLEETEVGEFINDPRPGWAGPELMFGGPQVDLRSIPPGTRWLVAGIPFDGTSSSRPGTAEGPSAVRRASRIFSSYVDSLGEHEMCDMRTGEVFRYQRQEVADAGDLHVYQTDTVRTFRAVACEVRELARTGATMLLLGGDHSISFATFAGWRSAMALRGFSADRLGYVQVDHHFDFGKFSALHGPLYHGANARRISELPGMAPERMAFVGVGSVTRKEQFDGLIADGFHVVKAREIQRQGAHEALNRTLAALASHCDAVYVSIDIDVLDASVAPGTANVTIGGLSSGDLFDVVAALRVLPIGALDIVEVSPRYDPTHRTQQIAAQLLFEFVYRSRVDDGVLNPTISNRSFKCAEGRRQ